MVQSIGCGSRAARAALLGAAMLSGGAFAGDGCAPSWGTMPGPDRWVRDLVVHDDGSGTELFVAGNFDTVAGLDAELIAKWDGTAWTPLLGPNGFGLRGTFLFRLAVYDSGSGPELYAAGGLSNLPDGTDIPGVAKWDGTDWSAVHDPSLPLPFGSPTNGPLREFVVHDDGRGEALFALGGAVGPGANRPYCVSRWDGQSWTPLVGEDGEGEFYLAWSGARYDDGSGAALYVNGISYDPEFDSVKISKWDGASWTTLPDPPGFSGFPSATATSMISFDDGTGERLFAAISNLTGGDSAIAAWDGSSWEIITDGVGGELFRLAVHEDDAGEALFIMGAFFDIDDEPMWRIARWDGSGFTPLADDGGPGLWGTVWTMASFDAGSGPDLYVGGDFAVPNETDVGDLGFWDLCLPGACAADLEPDGVLDLADLVAFVAAFTAADPLADFAEPEGVFDLADLVAFVAAFNAGCP